jgi:hypothetical protein
MVGIANDLNISQSGIVSFNSTNGVFAGRTITGGTGISVTNGNGISGNPTISLVGGGVSLEHLTGNTGGALNPDGSNNINIVTLNSTPILAGLSSTLTLDFGLTTNLILGSTPPLAGALLNVGVGKTTLLSLTSGLSNTAVGVGAGQNINSGSSNTAIGSGALNALTTGSNNIVLVGATAYSGAEDSNIVIGSTGQTGESHVIRIGQQGATAGFQNSCFIAGITGVTVSNQQIVTIDAGGGTTNGNMGTVATIPVANGGTGAATLTGILIGHGTSAVTANTVTQFDVLVGGASNAITSIGPGTAGQVLQSGGAAANPVYSTATYPATAGTSGNVLTSDGTNWISSTPSSALSIASVTLTSSQIKSLHATPIAIVAAPGAGKVIVLVNAICKFKYGGSNVFVAGAGQTINLYYSNTIAFVGNFGNNVTLVGTTTGYTYPGLTSNLINQSFENLALNAYNPVATEISGNAANDNTFTISCVYYIATLA